MRKLVIFGAGEFAEIAHYYFTHDSPSQVVGFTVDREYLREHRFRGLPVVPFDEVLRHFPPAEHDMFVALGIGGVNRKRAAKVAEAERLGSATRIGFHTRIGDHCWIVSAIFGESVTVGEGTFVGLNATVAPCLSVGSHTIIGAGALILRDTAADAVYRGQESRPSRVPASRLWRG